MRRFKFIGDPKEYTSKGCQQPFMVDHIYSYDFIGLGCTMPISEYIYFSGNRDWQEVFEEPTLQDRIQELKDFAKGQGLKVDVVVDKLPKRVEVEPLHSSGSGFDSNKNKDVWKYKFDFMINWNNSNPLRAMVMHGEVLPFLAKQLEKYLNGEVE